MTAKPLSVLVLGQSGQVARCLADEARSDLRITCWGRDTLDHAAQSVGRDFDDLYDKAGPFDAVINAAAYTAVDKAEEEEALATAINGAAPAAVAGVCAQKGVPFLHISTDYVFDGEKSVPYQEADATGPAGAYGRSKLAGETGVLAANPAALIFRTAWVYSPYGNNFLKTMLRLSTREKLTVVADQIGNPTSAVDIAQALVHVVKQITASPQPNASTPSPSGIFHLVGTGSTSWHGFAEAIFELTDERPRVDAITSAEYPTPAKRPANSRLDTQKLATNFGLTLPYWRDSVRDCIAALDSVA